MQELLNILNEVRPDVDFETETSLVDDGILESLDLVMIVGQIIEAFDVEITVDDLTPENFTSAETIMQLIERKKQ